MPKERAMETSKSSYGLKRTVIIVLADVLALVEIGVAMYISTQNPQTFTVTFLKVFLSLFVPTVVLAVGGLLYIRPKRLENEDDEEAESVY
jgi:hypothetical protein